MSRDRGQGTRDRALALLAALALFVAPVFATTVTGVVTDGLGNPATGQLAISWPSFVTAGGAFVARGSVTIPLGSGAFAINLQPNEGANPSGTFYTVRISGPVVNAVETWVVPSSPSTVDVASVRVVIPPSPSAVLQVSQIPGLPASILISGTLDPALLPAGYGGIDCGAPTPLTIAAGTITVTGSACYTVDTEGAAASDDLTAIDCPVGAMFVLRSADSARTVRIVDGNGVLDAQANFELDHVSDLWQGLCRSTNQVVEVSRANAR